VRTVKAIFWIVVGAALAIGMLFFGIKAVGSLMSDQGLWKSGVATDLVRVSGREKSSRMILKTYELDVEFLDAKRVEHKGKIEFTTLFMGVDQKQEPTVHYDAANPEKFALSWAIDTVTGRWMAAVFFLLMAPVFGLGAFKVAQKHLAAAREPAVVPPARGQSAG
jgi:hypothetical protein